MSSVNSIRDTFFEECEELLESLTDGLNDMAGGDDSSDTVNAVFRAVHSVKGGAGAFGLDQLVSFAHSFETVLDSLRNGSIDQTPDLMRVLHKSGDLLANIIEAARSETVFEHPSLESTLEALEAWGPSTVPGETVDGAFEFQPMTIDVLGGDDAILDTLPMGEHSGFEIAFKPHWAFYANGHDPFLLFTALSQIGSIDVALRNTALPTLEELTKNSSHLSWDIRLTTEESETVLYEIFEFVEGLCDLEISPISNTGAQSAEAGGIANAAIETMAAADQVPTPDSATQDRAKPTGPKPTLRVDLDRVDRLINTVGELIINQAMIAQRMGEHATLLNSDLANDLDNYRLLARDIQEAVMAIRAQPVKPLFQRMSRIVRESADEVQKTARLAVKGEGTEIDKTIIERLADPLTHMVRNAVDHGLEFKEDRIAVGKDPEGTITLSAAHRSGSILIEVEDDGGGLNKEKIYTIALEKGLISAEQEFSDAEIFNLLFLPGFSTVEKITNLSGRGVGMDVVKNSVAALGGRIVISSTPGIGTKFSITLPLTLAVMDGMVISVADQTMVVPISAMIETIRPEPSDLHVLGTTQQLISVRGQYVPVIDVAEILGLTRYDTCPAPEVYLLIEAENVGQCALGIDQIFDQRQVVIKSLEGNYQSIPGVAAATILGDGKIALILDTDAVAQMQRAAPEIKYVANPQMELSHG